MLKRSENNLNQLVRIAWELGLATKNQNSGNENELMLNAISDHLHTTGWSLQKGMWTRGLLHPEITWTKNMYSPLFPKGTLYLLMKWPWREWIENAVEQKKTVSTLVDSERDSVEDMDGQSHVLRVTICPEGAVECIIFVKPSYYPVFTELERAFIDSMLANVEPAPVQSQLDETEVIAKAVLPKRQREVLELLLQGETLKEIAATLEISRHTVNDYTKSLYRHFGVCGRAQLAALFLNPAQLELSHTE